MVLYEDDDGENIVIDDIKNWLFNNWLINNWLLIINN